MIIMIIVLISVILLLTTNDKFMEKTHYLEKRLFGSKKLNYYENFVLNFFIDKLNTNIQSKLYKQLELYNYIARLSKRKIVAFAYFGYFSDKNIPEEYLVPLKMNDIIVCKLSIKVSSQNKQDKITAEIYMDNGRLQEIHFNKPPKNVFTKDCSIEIINTDILVDVSREQIYQLVSVKDTSILTGKLREWLKKWEIRDLCILDNKNMHKYFLKQIDAKLPDEYLDLAYQVEKFKIKHIEFNGLSQIRSILTPDDNYYILLEISGQGVIAVKHGAKTPVLYYVDNEDHDFKEIKQNLYEYVDDELNKAF